MQVFQILEELNNISVSKGIAWVNNTDDGTYSKIAAYALSYNLGQLLNYGLTGGQNQIVLTSKGFRTFPQAIQDLVGTTGYIRFSQGINIENGMLDTKRNTTVTKI